MARPKGPERKQIGLRLLATSIEILDAEASRRGKSLTAWLTECLDRDAERLQQDLSPQQGEK